MLDDIKSTGAAIVVALLGIAIGIPKLLNLYKGDKIEGGILDRIVRHEARMDRMDKLIHKQQIRLTRLQVLVLQMNSLLVQNGIALSEAMKAEMLELTEDEDDSPISRMPD